MKIKIEYTEGKATVTREWDLADNGPRMRELMLECENWEPEETEEEEPEKEPEEEKQETAEVKLPFYTGKTKKAESTPGFAPPERGIGFVLLKCPNCGRVKARNIQLPTDRFVCQCGQEMLFDNLATAYFHCTSCEKNWRYKTNIEDAGVTATCIHCGCEMNSWWNKKQRAYMPVR